MDKPARTVDEIKQGGAASGVTGAPLERSAIQESAAGASGSEARTGDSPHTQTVASAVRGLFFTPEGKLRVNETGTVVVMVASGYIFAQDNTNGHLSSIGQVVFALLKCGLLAVMVTAVLCLYSKLPAIQKLSPKKHWAYIFGFVAIAVLLSLAYKFGQYRGSDALMTSFGFSSEETPDPAIAKIQEAYRAEMKAAKDNYLNRLKAAGTIPEGPPDKPIR